MLERRAVSHRRTVTAFLLAATLLAAHPTKPRRRVYHPVNLDVAPAPEIDAYVADQVTEAKNVLDNLNVANVLLSPYLVSAVYYHDGFLADFATDRNNASPERRIIGQISAMLSAERKAQFIALLHRLASSQSGQGPDRRLLPVPYAMSGGGHPNAIDLFTPEGTPVHSSTRGVVILADRDWSPDDLFSTSSRKGGNSVIVFDPAQDRFYRYCHMTDVQVAAGDVLEAGQTVGNVGHTGISASQPGHGRHLHFEVNEYADGRVHALNVKQLRALLKQWRTGSASASIPARATRLVKR